MGLPVVSVPSFAWILGHGLFQWLQQEFFSSLLAGGWGGLRFGAVDAFGADAWVPRCGRGVVESRPARLPSPLRSAARRVLRRSWQRSLSCRNTARRGRAGRREVTSTSLKKLIITRLAASLRIKHVGIERGRCRLALHRQRGGETGAFAGLHPDGFETDRAPADVRGAESATGTSRLSTSFGSRQR